MKRTKEILTLILALVMTLAMSATAFAATEVAGSGDGSITIKNANDGETYTIYKIFDATVSEDGNVSYTTDADTYHIMSEMDGCPFEFTTSDGETYYVTIKSGYVDENGEPTKAFVSWLESYVKDNLSDDGIEGKADENGLTFTEVAYGYYFVTTTTGSVVSVDTVSGKNVEICEKNEGPDIEKTVSSDGEEYGETSSASVGDTVYFKIEITVAEGATNYVLHDVISDGLKYNEATSVEINEETADEDSDYTVLTGESMSDETCTFEIEFNDDVLTSGTKIVIYYTATLTSDAIEYDCVTNNAKVSYGDNQYTTEEETKTYTYGFGLVKTDESDGLLEGAKFTLKNSDGEFIYFLYDSTTNTYVVCSEDAAGATTEITVFDGYVKIEGLATGTYTLTETTAPEGYNAMEGTEEITITEDNYATLNGYSYVSGGVKIENKAGSTLPSTGGMGTTVLYVLGFVLILGAGIVLVIRRRGNA